MYPLRFEADYVEQRSRLTTFFRLIMAIPLFIVLYFWALAALVAVVIAWFALLITGSYPRGLYDFVAGLMRFGTRVNGYVYLMTDEYPPFSGGEHPEFPVRLHVAPPQDSYDRLKVLLRVFYVIPAAILNYALTLLAQLISVVAWFLIVVTGSQNRSLHDLIHLGVSYQARVAGLFLLVTETYPPISDPDSGQIGQDQQAPTLAIDASGDISGVSQTSESEGSHSG